MHDVAFRAIIIVIRTVHVEPAVELDASGICCITVRDDRIVRESGVPCQAHECENAKDEQKAPKPDAKNRPHKQLDRRKYRALK